MIEDPGRFLKWAKDHLVGFGIIIYFHFVVIVSGSIM